MPAVLASLAVTLLLRASDVSSAAAAPSSRPTVQPTPNPIWTVPIAHSAGVLLGMRLSVSILWPSAYDPFTFDQNFRQFGHAYTRPPEFHSDLPLVESDEDPWPINLVGHPLFGSEIYQRARSCHFGPAGAFVFTAVTSAFWEYGVESFHKQPSAVDLVVTPILGGLLGEARYRASSHLARGPQTLTRRILKVIVDPFGEAERSWLHTRC